MRECVPYEVYAVKYAEVDVARAHVFLGGGGDDHDAGQHLDFFVWAVVGPDHTWVVDTGFAELDARQRGRTLVRSVTDGLAAVGVDAATATDVIVTHLHYDHIGGLAQFPRARFHLQDAEMAYATGRLMTHAPLAGAFTGRHVADMVLNVHDQRVVFHDGDAELAPGLSVHLIGGHTMGLQAVRVWTEIGWMVLASDAAHFYENIDEVRPFAIVHDVGRMIEGYGRLRSLAEDPSFIVPGHDPLVFDRYPPAAPGLEGIAVRLDRIPS